jgi:hypothetical protein
MTDQNKEQQPAPVCPDGPDGNHHVAPIGSDEEWMPSKAPCYYCGEKQMGQHDQEKRK